MEIPHIAARLGSSLLFNNFLAIVRTAFFANSVRKNEFSALGAFYDAGDGELPVVRTSFISASFGYFFLRYCHLPTPPYIVHYTTIIYDIILHQLLFVK